MPKELTEEQKAAKALYAKQWYAKNKERQLIKHKEWLANNREKVNQTQKEWLKRRTPEQMEKARARSKRWDDKNKQRLIDERKAQYTPEERRKRHLKHKFGLTQETWDALFEAQGKVCAICKTPDPDSARGWHTDHCHSTGKVRGILCKRCNTTLGLMRDNTTYLANAIEYLVSS